MDNALIDDRRIRVDFSQSVAKLWKQFRHGKRSTKDGCFKCGAPDHIARDCMEEPDGKQEGPKYSLKDSNIQHGGHDHKSYDMLFDEEEIENTDQKQSKKIKTSHHKLENSRHRDQDNKSSGRHKDEADRSRRHQGDEKDKPNGRDDQHHIDRRTEKNGDREHYRKHKHRTDEGDYKSGSSRDGKDAYGSESYRKDEGEHGKRRAERDRHRRDDRSYERSRDRDRDRDEESYRERRNRDGRR